MQLFKEYAVLIDAMVCPRSLQLVVVVVVVQIDSELVLVKN